MGFLRSFLRHHLAGKQVVGSPSVGCFLRLKSKNRMEAKYMKSKDLAILYEQFTYIKIKSCIAKREGNEKGKNNNKKRSN